MVTESTSDAARDLFGWPSVWPTPQQVIDIGVMRDPDLPDLSGAYLAGDYCAGTVWGIGRDGDDTWRMGELLKTTLRITGSGRDEDGRLYVTSCDCHYQEASQDTGSVWRIVAATEIPEGAITAPERTEPFSHQHQHGDGGEEGEDEGRHQDDDGSGEGETRSGDGSA